MKTEDLRAMSQEDLEKEVLSLTKASFSLRMQKATNQLNNTSELKKIRRSIAQIKTILTEKAAAK